jgi:hypothetical protein
MIKTTLANAAVALQEVMAGLPSGLEARSDFFIQWRTRTLELLERIFAEDHEPARLFKEIEFSPRRLTKNEAKDEQLKLDAYLAGCAAAKTLLEGLVAKLSAPEPAATTEAQGEVQTPAVMVDARPLPEPEPTQAAPAAPKPEAQPANSEAPPLAAPKPAEAAIPKAPEVVEVAPPKPPEPAPVMTIVSQDNSQTDGVVSGGTMETRELCSPVRSSLSRVLGAWDKGDRDMALVLSAQLLADLTVLSRDEKFKATFDKVVSKSFENGAAEAVKSAAPLCVWSLVAAMNEVMRAA